MPRSRRVDFEGAVQHVVVRGVNRRALFQDDADRCEFTRRVEIKRSQLGQGVFAWALMPNHVHLVLRTRHESVSRFMAGLGTGYAKYFNERHGRVGHLFQNRFWSVAVADERQLRATIAYVFLNPLRAGLISSVDRLVSYPWTGYAALMGRQPPIPWMDVAALRAWVVGDGPGWRSRLDRWIRRQALEGSAPRPADTVQAAGEDGDTGGRDADACGAGLPSATVGTRDRGTESAVLQPGLEALIERVCSDLGADLRAVRGGDRRQVSCDARAVAVFLATERLGQRADGVAAAVGLSRSGVSRSRRRGEVISARLGI